MKKILLSASLLAGLLISANAQENAAESGVYKQEAGDNNLEVHFAPLGANPISIGGIRFRTFTSATTALRVNAYLGFSNTTGIKQQEDTDNDLIELKEKSSSFTIALAPGIEKHFAGTDRISPYVGAELPLKWNTSSEKQEFQNADKGVEWSKTSEGFFEIGLNAVAGVDFYFTKKMYLGTELGFGLTYHKDAASKNKVSTGTAAGPAKNGSSFTLAPNVQTQIRLGFLF